MSFMNVGFEGAKRATEAILAGAFDALAVGDADALALAAADSEAEIEDLGVCGAAFAVVGGGVRAKPNAVDGTACLNGKAVHLGVHFGQVLHGKVFAADTGLVGGHGDGVACLR